MAHSGTGTNSGNWTMIMEMVRCEADRTDMVLLRADWCSERSPVRWIPRKSVVQNVMQRFEKLQLYPIFSGHAFRAGGSKK